MRILLIILLFSTTAKAQILGIVNTPENILVRGNSLVNGSYASVTDSNLVGRIIAISHRRDVVKNQGIPGDMIFSTMLSTFQDSITNNYKVGYKNIVIGWEITNELKACLDGGYGSQLCTDSTYNRYKRFFLQSISAGFDVIAGTCIDRGGTLPAAFDSSRLAINQRIVDSFPSLGILVADVAADARLSDADNTTYYHGDKVHLIDAGFRVVFDIFYERLRLILK